MAHGTPTLATGKICYLEIPAADMERSSSFYRDAFGWELRTRGDGAIAFDDTVKEVSGTWVTVSNATSRSAVGGRPRRRSADLPPRDRSDDCSLDDLADI